MNILTEAIKNSILITGLVMVMMLLIEYINIHTHGNSFKKLQNSPVKQVFVATLLGLVPGCIGGFAVVSLFTHKLISFGALIAMMIASSGDEAFVLMAMIPKTAIILFILLFFIAIIAGIVVDRLYKKVPTPFDSAHFEIHEGCGLNAPPVFGSNVLKNLKKPGKERFLILLGISIFIVAVTLGLLEHQHVEVAAAEGHNHVESTVACEHDHSGELNIFNERWLNLIFAGISLLTLFLTASANDHFIKEHLWKHVVKKHFKSIFLWTFGALLLIQFGMQFLDIEHWIKQNVLFMIFLAVIIGLIPESGPHMVFITLFASGVVPFSVLLASSIVQDGHTALPLLAESKGSFFKAKIINMAIGLVVGIVFHLFAL